MPALGMTGGRRAQILNTLDEAGADPLENSC